MQPFEPAKATPGTVMVGVDPSTLLANRDELELSRLQLQRRLIAAGRKRNTMIEVNRDGVIIQGNHGARAAAEAGIAVDVLVVNCPHPHFGPILSIPVVNR
jgi:hypothetical protein